MRICEKIKILIRTDKKLTEILKRISINPGGILMKIIIIVLIITFIMKIFGPWLVNIRIESVKDSDEKKCFVGPAAPLPPLIYANDYSNVKQHLRNQFT